MQSFSLHIIPSIHNKSRLSSVGSYYISVYSQGFCPFSMSNAGGNVQNKTLFENSEDFWQNLIFIKTGSAVLRHRREDLHILQPGHR